MLHPARRVATVDRHRTLCGAQCLIKTCHGQFDPDHRPPRGHRTLILTKHLLGEHKGFMGSVRGHKRRHIVLARDPRRHGRQGRCCGCSHIGGQIVSPTAIDPVKSEKGRPCGRPHCVSIHDAAVAASVTGRGQKLTWSCEMTLTWVSFSPGTPMLSRQPAPVMAFSPWIKPIPDMLPREMPT